MSSVVSFVHRLNQECAVLMSNGESPLTLTQFLALDAISKSPGASQARIVMLTAIDRSTLADVMRRMLKLGLIHRKRDARDSRAYVLRLTKDGEAALAAARDVASKVQKSLMGRYPGLRSALDAQTRLVAAE